MPLSVTAKPQPPKAPMSPDSNPCVYGKLAAGANTWNVRTADPQCPSRCSAGVAALFALHPLHVESVAWVAERKDVLNGLFPQIMIYPVDLILGNKFMKFPVQLSS